MTSTSPPFIITQKKRGQYPAILAKHWSVTYYAIITIPPMELSSEVEADLAKPTKQTGKSHYANDSFTLELHLISFTWTKLIFEYLTVKL